MNVQPSGEVNALLETAREHRRRGDRASALTAFQAAAKADTSNRAIDVAVAGELRALDRLDEADVLLRQILEKEPGSIAALVEQGHLARRRGESAAALAAFERASAIDPKHLGLKVEIARSLRTLDRLDDAVRVLDETLQLDPKFLAALIEQGHARRKAGDHVGALASFVAAAAGDRAHAGIKLEIASSLKALSKTAEAEATLRALVDASPKHLPALVALGHLLIETGRLDEATVTFQSAQAMEPHDPRASAALARIARLRNDQPGVLRHMKAMAASDPHNLDTRRMLAAEFRVQGDVAAAKAELHALLEVHPGDAGSWVQLGLLYRIDRDHKKAIAAFESAHMHQPEAVEPLVEMARETWAAGDPVAANAHLADALALQPKHTGALALSAEWALIGGRPEDALKLVQEAIDADPKQLGLRLLAARAAAAVPDRAASDRHLNDARSSFGASPDILATRIYVLRSFHDFGGIRSLIAEGEAAMANPALWIEGVSAALAVGDFNAAERILDKGPSTSRREKAWGAFLRGQLAAAKRDYATAGEHYGAALDLDPANGAWEGEFAKAALLTLDTDAADAHLRKSVELGRAAALSRHESTNPSQHHVGQLLDDFTLDRALLVGLRQALDPKDRDRVNALKALVRDNPDSTAAALMLLLEMRRTGELRYAPTRFGRLMPARIPRRVMQFWDTEAVPVDIAALMETWRDERGTYEYTAFNEATAKAYLTSHSHFDVVRAFRRASHPAQRADIFRLSYIAKEGGIYADADDRRVASLDQLAPKDATFVAYQEDYGTLANNFLAAEPNHPVIKRALQMVVAAVNRGDADSIWLSSGPGLMTRAFAQSAADSDAKTWFGRALIRELHEMQALVEIHCPAAYKRTDRHWSVAAKQAGKANRRAKAK